LKGGLGGEERFRGLKAQKRVRMSDGDLIDMIGMSTGGNKSAARVNPKRQASVPR